MHSQKYKDMMQDNSVNFYDVVKEAESYFKTINIDKKGSGYKKFMRWASGNEYKYYPTGNRSKIDHAFPEKAYSKYISTNKKKLSKTSNSGSWTEVGPVSIENISGHYAAGIGRIDDFQVNPNNTNEIYASSKSGGLWKTTNEGLTWTATATETLKASGVDAIAVDPLDFNHVFITVQNAINNYSYGIYESLDGGDSFTETRFNPQNLNLGGLGSNFKIYSLISHPTRKNMLFAGTSRGLYKTTDNFNTWSKVINSGQIIQIEAHPTQANTIYAYNNDNKNLIYISSNTGDNFSTTTINGNDNNTAKISLTNHAPNDVYWASAAGVFKSTNTGQSFSFISKQLSSLEDVSTDVFTVNSEDKNNMIIGGVDAANSIDGGANFTKRTSWLLSDPIHGNGTLQQNYFNTRAYVHADLRKAKSINGVFYVSTDGLLAKSIDQGVSWENLMLRNTPGIRENYKLGVSQSNNQVVICGSQDNGTSIKTANGWVEAYGADGMEGLVAPLNPNYMIGSIQLGDRLRTTNGGKNFTSVSATGEKGWWESPIAYDPNDQFKIYDFNNGVHVSNDFGMNYEYTGSPEFLKADPKNYWLQIRNAEIAQNNSKIIIVSRSSEIEKSTNGGVSFTNIKNSLPNREIQDIGFNPNNDDDIIVVYANYENDGKKIYRTINGGVSWSNITFNMGNIPVHAVVIDHTANPNIYVGTEIGVYYKPLNGNTWTLYNDGLPNVSIQELEINYGANMLKAATWGRGLWEYKLVNRANYPSIENTVISTPPTLKSPKEGSKQIVTSTINYKGNLTNVEVRYSVNNLLFNNIIPMSNTTGNTWVSNTSLPTNTKKDKVYFKIFATGDKVDQTSSYKFMYEVKESVYCNAKGKDGTGGDYITEVKLGNFINTSNNNSYTLYNNLETITLKTKETYNVSVKLNATFTGDKAAVWIDFNGDTTFSNNELITMSAYSNNIANGTILVPEDAVLNKPVRMRVSNIYNAIITPCADAFGEVEDYILNFTEGDTIIDADGYCIAKGKDGTGADYITEVTLGDFVNTTTNNSYTLYNNLEAIRLEVNKTYQLSVKLGFAFAEDKAAAWIDFNADNIFSSSELINMSAYNNSTSTGTITIPEDVKLNQELRMRVSNIYNEDIAPCTDTFGEVEDYVVVITGNTLNILNFEYNDTSINIHPVPSKKYVYVTSNHIITKVELFDLNGRKVVHQNNLKENKTKIDVEYLPKSVYILYIYTKNKIIVKKIVRA